jgi:hypothetical protein
MRMAITMGAYAAVLGTRIIFLLTKSSRPRPNSSYVARPVICRCRSVTKRHADTAKEPN